MKEEKKIEFTQKWIGDAVKKLLQKEDIYESDMERIKYMRIGDCDFGGEYTIEMSTAAPPEPFCTTDGGDEWATGGGANVTGRFIRLYSAEYQDMTFLRAMPLLRVLEVVESRFVSLEGIDDLTRLKQLCCWFE